MSCQYLLLASITFVFFYILLKNKLINRKIQSRFPNWYDFKREILSSALACVIFTFVPSILDLPQIQAHTFYYTDIHQYGWLYFFAAFPVMLIIHDAYFYWTHRIMHHRFLFSRFHKVHHMSSNPSPWTSLSFNLLESCVQVGILPVFLLIMPIHPLHINIFFFFMISYVVYGHLGYELYPAGFTKHWLGKWINTSVGHNLHHQNSKYQFGLYFTFWDSLMGTLNPDYQQRYEQVTDANRLLTENSHS